MGLFSKKNNIETEESKELNDLLVLALTIDQVTGTWIELSESVSENTKQQVIGARKIVVEYIKQLKEAGFYSNGAVQKFVKEQYPWINKSNFIKLIELGKFI